MMLLPLLLAADVSNSNFNNGFSSYSYCEERIVPLKRDVQLFDYCLTDVIRIESNDFVNNFANEYFETQEIFDNRQSFLMGISNNIFENSRFLDMKEEEALNLAFFNSLVKKPTLKGRK